MRQIGTLNDAAQAQRLADYLLTLGITTRVLPEKEGSSIWIRDEGQVERARKEFSEFQLSPADARYDAGRLAGELRREEEKLAREAQKRIIDVRSSWGRMAARQMPVTLALIGISLLVFLASDMGQQYKGSLEYLLITDYQRAIDEVQAELVVDGAGVAAEPNAAVRKRWGELREIRRGEIWRTVTPMFIHFGILHLIGNMYWLHQFGGAIERRRGHWRFLILVLVISAAANFAQFWLPDPLRVVQGRQAMELSPQPNFGGMSAVVFGLFGYVWMKSRYDSTSGFYMDEQTVVLMLVWLAVCSFGVVGSVANSMGTELDVANVAHAVGLLVGAGIGYVRSVLK